MMKLLPYLALFLLARPLRADLEVIAVRPTGSSLDLSTQIESEHAVRRALSWLAARQRDDGSWGEATNRVALTAITLLAFAMPQDLEHDRARSHGISWLQRHPAGPADPLETHAWTLLASFHLLDATSETDRCLNRLIEAAPDTGDSPEAQTFWEKSVKLARRKTADAPAPPAPLSLDWTADEWTAWIRAADPESLWRQVAWLNRAGEKRLRIRDGTVDWRHEIAFRLLSGQRRDPEGGAYWDAQDAEAQIRATAFGALTLLSL